MLYEVITVEETLLKENVPEKEISKTPPSSIVNFAGTNPNPKKPKKKWWNPKIALRNNFV